ncbi:MAG TPA: hypothetical protein VJ279_12235 [Hanamia sp.]|nr:hypothetical protein [Hanamia sp.]
MKTIIFFCVVIAITGCTHDVDLSKIIPGTYLMKSQTLNDGKKDTRYTDLKQLKIYTDKFFMYTQVNPNDSVSAFGVGTYVAGKNDSLTENVIYSASDTSFNAEPASYHLSIELTSEGYNQVIKDIVFDGQKSMLTEEYNRIGTKTTSALDGVWKEIKGYSVSGTDTVEYNRTQYKAFYSGYFMFGHSVKDSSGKTRVGMGFGTFELEGNNKLMETDLNSTYSIIAGQSFTIDISMDGADKYHQTITNSDGSKSIEFYERLK